MVYHHPLVISWAVDVYSNLRDAHTSHCWYIPWYSNYFPIKSDYINLHCFPIAFVAAVVIAVVAVVVVVVVVLLLLLVGGEIAW